VVIIYLIAYFLKQIPGDTINRLLPAICGALGLVIGVVCFYTLPDFIAAENWLTAAAIGIVSGFSATGVNQVFKQMSKPKEGADNGNNIK
jgi:hypothetical protein